MKYKTGSAKRIIVALDVSTKEEAIDLVNQLRQADIFKVGLKLFIAEGPSLLQEIRGLRKKVFLDLKLHDIPNTVSQAVKMSIKHGAHMLTLHSSGGMEMMAAAVEAARTERERKPPALLAVTVLTSLKNNDLDRIGIRDSTDLQVLRLAKLAKEAGMDGVVCSPQETDLIKGELGRDFMVVTPGIRPAWAASYDQKRIMTPALAIEKGADYLVIGRPIIEAPSPQEAFLKICQELNGAVNSPYRKNRT